jgi:hypothetical protein
MAVDNARGCDGTGRAGRGLRSEAPAVPSRCGGIVLTTSPSETATAEIQEALHGEAAAA